MPKNTDICKECGYEYGLHSADEERCPKNAGQLINSQLDFYATKFDDGLYGVDQLRAEIARLTAGSEAMQEDARNNTATIKAQAEEIRTLKQELDQLKACKHMHVKIHSRLYRPSTREEPAEFEYKAECKDCGELFSADDVDEWAEVEE